MLRTLGIKGMAKALRQALSDRKIELSHSDCLELIAKQFGVKDWNTLSAAVGQDAGDKPLLFSVVGDEIMLHRTTQRLDVNDTDLSGSRFNDANLSGSQFQNINLSGVTFSNCRMPGAMLDGVPLEEIVAAYRKSQAS
jgi:uncharacterized protein YjbI with pentapeptide repeats